MLNEPILSIWKLPPHLQHSGLLEAEAILEQTSDVGQVHAQESAGRWGLVHLIAHWADTGNHESHLYSAKRSRTHVQGIDMHAASQAQVGCRSVIVMMHCFSHLTLFSSLLEVSDLQHPSLDTTCNRDLLGVTTFKMLCHSL